MTYKSKIIYACALSTALLLTACEGDRPNIPNLEICEEICRNTVKTKEYFALMDMRWDENGLKPIPQGSFYVNGPNGVIVTPSKAEGLDPNCFAEKPFVFPNAESEQLKANDYAPDLADKDLTWGNTTIMFINFDKDGRLESRELKKEDANKSDHVISDLNSVLGSSSQSSTPEFEYVRDRLTKLNMPQVSQLTGSANTGPGRPLPGDISLEGFESIDLNGLPVEKTPFFKPLPSVNGNGVKDHVFFYVLLDENLKFNRKGGLLPYAPAANNALGQLYTPYIQYEIAPLDKKKKQLVEVMPVYFYRGGNMAKEFDKERNPKGRCVYPYDIGVIADGQIGFPQKTPLKIDPEVEADGPVLN